MLSPGWNLRKEAGNICICKHIFACCPKKEVGRKGACKKSGSLSHHLPPPPPRPSTTPPLPPSHLMMTDMANATLPNELQTKSSPDWIRSWV